MLTSSRTTRASEPRATTTSLSAVNVPSGVRPAWQDLRRSSAIRSPIANAPASSFSSTRLELVRLGLRQEADLAEVDAEDRHVDLGDRLRGAQERAVAAEHDEGVGRRQLATSVSAVSPAGAAQCSSPCIRHQPAARSRSSSAASLVGLYAKPIRVTVIPAASQAAVDRAVDQRRRGRRTPGPASRWTRNSRLPSGPRIGDAIDAARPEPERRGASPRPRASTRAMDRRVAHDAARRVRPCRPRTAA